MGLLDDSIKEIDEDFIYISDFIDLVAMLKTNSISDLAKYLLRERFDEHVHVYSIDKALRVTKLEDSQYVTDLLETIVNEYAYFSDKGRLPRQIVLNLEDLTYFFKRKQASEIPCIKKLDIDFTRDSITQEISLIYENRLSDIRDIAKKHHEKMVNQPNKLHFKGWLDLDEVACIMCGGDIELIKILKREDPNFTPMIKEFWSCRNFLQSGIDRHKLKCDGNGLFSNESVAKFLYENGFIIAGFNEGLAIPSKSTSLTATQDDDELSDNTAQSYQATIGLLLELMTEPRTKGGTKPFQSEADILRLIATKLVKGQSTGTVAPRFKLAKDALSSKRKEPDELYKAPPK